MSTAVRYVGRRSGDGIDDSLSGPETIEVAFGGDILVIEDPLSFPWHLAAEEDWFTGVLVDLRECSEADLVALYEVLPVLTPSDRLVVREDQRAEVLRRLRLPDEVALSDLPTDVRSVVASDKSAQVRLREALGRAVAAGLDSLTETGRVVDCSAPHQWLSALVPARHEYHSIPELHEVPSAFGDVIVQWGPVDNAKALHRAHQALRENGLLVFVLDGREVATAGTPNVSDLISAIDDSFGAHQVVELVWGLRSRPGAHPTGAIIAIRPLGSAPNA